MSLLLAAVAIAPVAQTTRTFTAESLGFAHASFEENGIRWEVNPGGLVPGWATYSQSDTTISMSVEASTTVNHYFRDSQVYHQGKYQVGYRVWTNVAPTKIDRLRFKIKAQTREYVEATLKGITPFPQNPSTFTAKAHVDSPTLSADMRVKEAFRQNLLGTTYGNGQNPVFKPLGSFLIPFAAKWKPSGSRWYTDTTFDVPWLYAKAEAHAGKASTPTVAATAQATSSVIWEITAIAIDK